MVHCILWLRCGCRSIVLWKFNNWTENVSTEWTAIHFVIFIVSSLCLERWQRRSFRCCRRWNAHFSSNHIKSRDWILFTSFRLFNGWSKNQWVNMHGGYWVCHLPVQLYSQVENRAEKAEKLKAFALGQFHNHFSLKSDRDFREKYVNATQCVKETQVSHPAQSKSIQSTQSKQLIIFPFAGFLSTSS